MTMSRSKQESLETFNKAATSYDSSYQNWTKPTHSFILAELRREPASSILDVGCGTGTMLSALNGDVRKAGLDLAPEMVNKAREKLGTDADLRVGDAERLPWSNDSFDVVTINLSFHHYENPEMVLAEARRVLRNEGRVIIGDVCLPFHLNRLANLLMRFRHEGGVHFYSEKEMRTLLNKAGFDNISWNRTTRRTFVVNARVV